LDNALKGIKVNTILGLTNNRIATGSTTGFVCIYDLKNNTQITKKICKPIKYKKTLKNYISVLCQVDENTIACGLLKRGYIYIWNFKDDTEKIIKIFGACYNNMIVLNNDLLTFISASSLFMVNLKTYKITDLIIAMPIVTCIALLNNNYIIGTDTESLHRPDNPDHVSIINKNILMQGQHSRKDIKYFTTQPHRLSTHVLPIDDDNLVVVEDTYCTPESDIITVHNIKTLKLINIIKQYDGKIKSIVNLGNNNIAYLANNKIIILNVLTGIHIQAIENIVLLNKLDDGFIAVDDESNIQIYR
jgi:WD40 repeat protein